MELNELFYYNFLLIHRAILQVPPTLLLICGCGCLQTFNYKTNEGLYNKARYKARV